MSRDDDAGNAHLMGQGGNGGNAGQSPSVRYGNAGAGGTGGLLLGQNGQNESLQ